MVLGERFRRGLVSVGSAPMRIVLLSLALSVSAATSLLCGCGGSDLPAAPPGQPMNPPMQDPAMAEMMGDTASSPTPTVAADDAKKAEEAKAAEEAKKAAEAKAADDAKKAEEAKAAEEAKKKGGKAPKPKEQAKPAPKDPASAPKPAPKDPAMAPKPAPKPTK